MYLLHKTYKKNIKSIRGNLYLLHFRGFMSICCTCCTCTIPFFLRPLELHWPFESTRLVSSTFSWPRPCGVPHKWLNNDYFLMKFKQILSAPRPASFCDFWCPWDYIVFFSPFFLCGRYLDIWQLPGSFVFSFFVFSGIPVHLLYLVYLYHSILSPSFGASLAVWIYTFDVFYIFVAPPVWCSPQMAKKTIHFRHRLRFATFGILGIISEI